MSSGYIPPHMRKAVKAAPITLNAERLADIELFPSLAAPLTPTTNSSKLNFKTMIEDRRKKDEEEALRAERDEFPELADATEAQLERLGFALLRCPKITPEVCLAFNERITELEASASMYSFVR